MIENKKSYRINSVLEYLRRNPEEFQLDLKYPSIKILYRNRKKRFTEFYRVKVVDRRSQNKIRHYWIRIVKNKTPKKISEALIKQYVIMGKVYEYFHSRPKGNLYLSCCEPISLLLEHSALVTRECSGTLLNIYLKKSIPQFHRRQILKHFYNCGIWLRQFHEKFKDETVSDPKFKNYLDRFQKSYGRNPRTGFQYISYCHDDYSPRNIFVSKNSVEVIDYVNVRKGFPEQDVEFFCSYVLKAKFNFLYPRNFKTEMISSFQRGYFKGDSED